MHYLNNEGGLIMENTMPTKDEALDQKIEYNDFCKLWNCPGLHIEYKCFACPILKDLKAMRKELHMGPIEFKRKAA